VPTRYAAVDVGTNTVLLTIAEAERGALRPLEQRAHITRLGKGVDRTERLDPNSRLATLDVITEYGAAMRDAGVDAAVAVCTSAVRDAADGSDFLARAAAALGAPVFVVSGDTEAALTFEGALTGISHVGPVTVFDVGGGSTEIISGSAGPESAWTRAVSLDIGSVRLTERHALGDAPDAGALEAVRRTIEQALVGAPPLDPSARVVGVAGTVTTLAAVHLGLLSYDAERVHGLVLPTPAVDDLVARLAASTLAERRAWAGMEPGRADVIVAGALIVQAVLHRAGASSLTVSDRGVRWGLLRRLAAGDSPARACGAGD
jgi:exopolyphosphatase/guanosine-5'-triphosphate,3'-diphosphate pyrophosphatase